MNISFSATKQQVRDKTKTVTRRIGWKNLKFDQVLDACEKCQGLKKGEKVAKICQIRVIHVCTQRLDLLLRPGMREWAEEEMVKEGFPGLSPSAFVGIFCKMNKCERDVMVRRIEFEYI